MPDVKCYAELIAAIDAMDPPPSTRAEKQALVDRWRLIERQRHRVASDGQMAASLITIEDIDSMLRTQKDRTRATRRGNDIMDGWQPAPVSQQLGMLQQDVVSVVRGAILGFGKAGVRAYNLTDYQSVTIYEQKKPAPDSKKLRIEFYSGRSGKLMVNMGRERQIRCRRLLKSMGIEIGHYKLSVVQWKPLIFEIDFVERVGVPRRARNAKDK